MGDHDLFWPVRLRPKPTQARPTLANPVQPNRWCLLLFLFFFFFFSILFVFVLLFIFFLFFFYFFFFFFCFFVPKHFCQTLHREP